MLETIPDCSRLVDNNMFIYKVEASMEWHEHMEFHIS